MSVERKTTNLKSVPHMHFKEIFVRYVSLYIYLISNIFLLADEKIGLVHVIGYKFTVGLY